MHCVFRHSPACRLTHQLLEIPVGDVGDAVQIDGHLVLRSAVLLDLDLHVVTPDLVHLREGAVSGRMRDKRKPVLNQCRRISRTT